MHTERVFPLGLVVAPAAATAIVVVGVVVAVDVAVAVLPVVHTQEVEDGDGEIATDEKSAREEGAAPSRPQSDFTLVECELIVLVLQGFLDEDRWGVC